MKMNVHEVKRMNKKVICEISKENYDDAVNKYLEQLQLEQNIVLFSRDSRKYYYMFQGLVHEIRLENDHIIDDTFESWSVEEKNFVMSVLDRRVYVM